MSPSLIVVVGVNAIILSRGEMLVLRRSAQVAQFAGRWDLPAGMVEPGETLERALRREIREETGLIVKIRGPVAARILFTSSARGGICITYLCGTKGRQTPTLAPEEHDRFRWVTPRVALRLKLRPPQTQAVCAFLSRA